MTKAGSERLVPKSVKPRFQVRQNGKVGIGISLLMDSWFSVRRAENIEVITASGVQLIYVKS